MTQRYIVIPGSESGHCCFEATVVDTEFVRIGAILDPTPRYEVVCECFEEHIAEDIAFALNNRKPS